MKELVYGWYRFNTNVNRAEAKTRNYGIMELLKRFSCDGIITEDQFG